MEDFEEKYKELGQKRTKVFKEKIRSTRGIKKTSSDDTKVLGYYISLRDESDEELKKLELEMEFLVSDHYESLKGAEKIGFAIERKLSVSSIDLTNYLRNDYQPYDILIKPVDLSEGMAFEIGESGLTLVGDSVYDIAIEAFAQWKVVLRDPDTYYRRYNVK